MSLRNADDRRSGQGPGCDQLPFVSRLAVDNPMSLKQEPWVAHLRTCAVCRNEAAEHARAVAVFAMVERESLSAESSELTWEAMVAVIEREQAAAESHSRFRTRWAIPAVAVATGALAVSLAIGWDGLQDGGEPAPARIVRVQPPEQRSMEQVVRWAIDSADPGSDPLRASAERMAKTEDPGADFAGAPEPESRELAATFSSGAGESLAGEEESARPPQRAIRLTRVAAGAQAQRPQVFAPTQPASNRFGHVQPLFRLEQRLMPVQSVSFNAHD